MVARIIAARSQLGASRQVFFVSIGGFDLHDNLLDQHPTLLTHIANALNSFYAATVELGIANAVTSFTASDFGRTLSSNGDGSDHGWGSHHFVLGGAVNGGRFYGALPSVSVNGPDDVGQGLPTTSLAATCPSAMHQRRRPIWACRHTGKLDGRQRCRPAAGSLFCSAEHRPIIQRVIWACSGRSVKHHCRENKVVGRTSVRRGAERKRLRRTEVRPTKTAYFRTSGVKHGCKARWLCAACRLGYKAIPARPAARCAWLVGARFRRSGQANRPTLRPGPDLATGGAYSPNCDPLPILA
jgi:hypothetical protein